MMYFTQEYGALLSRKKDFVFRILCRFVSIKIFSVIHSMVLILNASCSLVFSKKAQTILLYLFVMKAQNALSLKHTVSLALYILRDRKILKAFLLGASN